ncbi:MAG TPA: 4Fe-4S dicluster domain-containing protein, partial [Thermoplasmata archaeon]|nr:4Fe-4S dicluster domain-containing protein [Thermoplasmata archaeon]
LEDWCKGCELCIKRCPTDSLERSDKLNKRGVYPPRLKEDNECNFCRLCELICPDFAITVTQEEGEGRVEKGRLIIGGVAQ